MEEKKDPLKDFSYEETRGEIEAKYLIIKNNPLFVEALNSINTTLLVLNSYRQVVFYNSALMKMLKIDSESDLLSLKPGAVFECTQTELSKSACGTTKSCTYCGIFNTFLASVQDKELSTGEAVLAISGNRNVDISVGSKPVVIEGVTFYVVTINDISDEKRKRALERVFFHDIINSAGGLDGLFSVIEMDKSAENINHVLPMARGLVTSLLDEIQSQRELLKAENNDLVTERRTFSVNKLLSETCDTMTFHPVAEGKEIAFTVSDQDIMLLSDKVLLKRVVVNLIKNALEATSTGDKVTVSYGKESHGVWIAVSNSKSMPGDIQERIFKRSFSTKGEDRGLGLYSVKLFTEKYLGGSVAFESDEEKGTVFTVLLPD